MLDIQELELSITWVMLNWTEKNLKSNGKLAVFAIMFCIDTVWNCFPVLLGNSVLNYFCFGSPCQGLSVFCLCDSVLKKLI